MDSETSSLIKTAITIITFIIGLAVSVWRITNASNKNKEELKTLIHGIDKRMVAIEVETKHTREDHDRVVKVESRVDGHDDDLARQWGRIRTAEKEEQKEVRST